MVSRQLPCVSSFGSEKQTKTTLELKTNAEDGAEEEDSSTSVLGYLDLPSLQLEVMAKKASVICLFCTVINRKGL